jgi:hypothetical protein
MAKLCIKELKEIENVGIDIPKFDIEKVKEWVLMIT